MCGIAGQINIKFQPVPSLEKRLEFMNELQAHRGPDGNTTWTHKKKYIGFAHRRLSIIDLSTGDQPMIDNFGNCIVYNGEIYNYIELKAQLKNFYPFKTSSDTEVILAAYQKWGEDCVNHLRGMFAFAIWNEKKHELFCARDRFGIKPLYYFLSKDNFFFSSEVKTILPFIDQVKTDLNGLKDYFVFQFPLGGKTLFESINQLLPAHHLTIKNGQIKIKKYWEVQYDLDWKHDEKYFIEKLKHLLSESIKYFSSCFQSRSY